MILSIVYTCDAPYATSGIYDGYARTLIIPSNVSVQAPGCSRDTFVLEKGVKIDYMNAIMCVYYRKL